MMMIVVLLVLVLVLLLMLLLLMKMLPRLVLFFAWVSVPLVVMILYFSLHNLDLWTSHLWPGKQGANDVARLP